MALCLYEADYAVPQPCTQSKILIVSALSCSRRGRRFLEHTLQHGIDPLAIPFLNNEVGVGGPILRAPPLYEKVVVEVEPEHLRDCLLRAIDTHCGI